MKKVYYCLFAICSFFIFSFGLSANTFTYNYNQDMINYMPNKWFGTNGWLSRVNNVIDIYSDSIWLSKDTIYVVKGQKDTNSQSFANLYLNYDDALFKYSFKLVGLKVFSIVTEDDLDTFISNYNNSSLKFVTSIEFSCSTLSSIIGSDFSGPKCDNYLVPFKKNRSYFNIYNSTSFDSFNFFGIQGYNSILGHYDSTNNILNDVFLYTKYGFDKPDLDSSYHVYSLDSEYDIDKLSNSYVNYVLYTNEKPVLDKFVFYGKKNVDGLYYWVDLSYDISKEELNSPYCVGDYDEPVYSNGKYSLKVSISSCSNISDFSSIYMKVYFKNSVLVSSYNFSGNNYSNVFLSDLCQDCIVDEVLQSSNKILVFSTINSSYSFPFYYLKYNDSSGEGIYSSVGLVDLNSSKLDSSNYFEYIVNYKSVYGQFNKSVGMSSDLNKAFYGVLVNAPNDTILKIKYLYVPVDLDGHSIVFVSNNDVNDDKTSSSIAYVDKDGNINHKDILGNFDFNSSSDIGIIKKLFSSGLDGIDNIFNASVQLLHFVTDLFNSLSFEIQSFLLILFCISMIVIFIKFIM